MIKTSMIPVIYIAGKYRADDPYDTYQLYENIEKARRLGVEVIKLNAMPLIPHCNTSFMEGLNTADFFIDGTKELMRRCDAVLIQTENWETSTGTKGEIEEANRLGIPVFWELGELKWWLKNQS